MTAMVVDQPSAIAFVAEGVRKYFLAEGLDSIVVDEVPERDKQTNQGTGGANRVVFLSGADEADEADFGVITGALQSADDPENPRSLGTWEQACRVSIWGFDSTNRDSKKAHREMAIQLFRWTMRAVQFVAHRDAIWGAVKKTKQIERSFGFEIIANLTISGPMADPTDLVAYPTPAITPNPAA